METTFSSYSIDFAAADAEKSLQAIFRASAMELAGDIDEHVLIRSEDDILGGGMLSQTGYREFHLLVFAVRQSQHRHGVGSNLLNALLRQPWRYCRDTVGTFDQEGYRITTVAKGKSAEFYRKNGFSACTFGELPVPFNRQCDSCPERAECLPVAMVFQGQGVGRFPGKG